jgi:hypothetical protein
MNIFLVDFENVHISGLKGIKQLSAEDKIVIFYSDNDCETVAVLTELRDDFLYAKISKSGQNALDFQLSTYLGFEIGKNSGNLAERAFWVVSKDTGFDNVVNFWLKSEFATHLKVKPKIKKIPNILQAFSNIPKDNENADVIEIMTNATTCNDFHSLLVKKFKSKAKDIYQQYKAEFKKLHNIK